MKKLMRRGWQTFALLILLTSYAQAYEEDQEKFPPYLLATGHNNTCIKDDNGVRCWGRSYYESEPVVAPDGLGDVRQLVMGHYHACALDENGVTCWGRNGDGQISVPETLTHPEKIFAGGYLSCAIDAPPAGDKHIECWGSGASWKQAGFPENVGSIRQVGIKNHICAIADNGLTCWGSNSHGQATVPNDLVDPQQVVVGDYYSCALDKTESGKQIRCWGSSSDGKLDPPEFENVIEIYGGGPHICGLVGI